MSYKIVDGKIIKSNFPKNLLKAQIKQIESTKVKTEVLNEAQSLARRTNLVRRVATSI